MHTDFDDLTREHKIGMALALPGALISLTVIGAFVGVPMMIVGAWYWTRAEDTADAA